MILEPKHTQSRVYQVTTALRMEIAGEKIEQLEEITLTIRLAEVSARRKIFDLTVTASQQTSNKAVFEWAAMMNQALWNIRVVTDPSGKAINLFISQSPQKEYEILKQLELKYRGKQGLPDVLLQVRQYFRQPQLLLPQLNEQGWQSVFFHGLYGVHSTNMPEQLPKVLPRFVGELDLPLRLTRTFEVSDNAHTSCVMQTKGALDREKFDRQGFVRWLKTLYDQYDLKVQERLEYEEQYQFDADHLIQHAETFFTFDAGNCYQFSMARIVDQVTIPNEQTTIRTQWMLSDL